MDKVFVPSNTSMCIDSIAAIVLTVCLGSSSLKLREALPLKGVFSCELQPYLLVDYVQQPTLSYRCVAPLSSIELIVTSLYFLAFTCTALLVFQSIVYWAAFAKLISSRRRNHIALLAHKRSRDYLDLAPEVKELVDSHKVTLFLVYTYVLHPHSALLRKLTDDATELLLRHQSQERGRIGPPQ